MICFNKDCAKDFTPKTHNQKYCSDECCKVATNKRIMEKYYEKKAVKNGALRICKKCKSKLSRYNLEGECCICQKNKYESKQKKLKEIIDDIS